MKSLLSGKTHRDSSAFRNDRLSGVWGKKQKNNGKTIAQLNNEAIEQSNNWAIEQNNWT